MLNLLIGIIGLIFSYISIRPSLEESKNDNQNTKNIRLKFSVDNSDSIVQKNNRTKLKILYSIILFGILAVLILSMYLNYDTIPIIKPALFSPLYKVMPVLFFGIGITSKSFAPLVIIFSLTLLAKNVLLKNSMNRIYNIIIFAILSIVSTIFFIIINGIDYLSYGANFISTSDNLTLYNLLSAYSPFILIIQLIFIGAELYQILANIIIEEEYTELISIKLNKFFIKLSFPIITILFILYWHYILK